MKLKEQILSAVLTITILSQVGCSLTNDYSEKEEKETASLSESLTPMPTVEADTALAYASPMNVPMSEEEYIKTTLKNNLYDETIDYLAVINRYFSLDDNEKLAMNDEYLKAIYMFLIHNGLDITELLPNFNNLLVMQLVPQCLDDESWHKVLGSLIEVDYGNLDYPLFEMYKPLAIYIHELSCHEEHTKNEYDAYTCVNLENAYHDLQLSQTR